MKYTRARAEADLDTIGCDAVLQAALLGEVAFG